MSRADQLLDAGALLPANAKVKDESIVDSISARIYRHPALGDQPVVKLTADNLAAGDDLTMDFLGFKPPEVQAKIARRRRQALGFPGWALVNDPEHARYALDLVKEFKKEAKRARSKPGHAYEAFVNIAKRLGKSVAHFLPSYWEQVGREYIDAGNTTYGQRAFGKAREAEKVHALKVDDKLRQDAFLEFALAGCVSTKALTEYGKELITTREPAEAWKFFRELCVRRTLGGMPPWTSMVKDLESLCKTAKIDPGPELESILTEIIDSPALARTAMGFWKAAGKIVKPLAEKNDHVAGVLLNLIPKSNSYYGNSDIWEWLNYLEAWGILENAWKEGVPAEAGPQGGPTAWYCRLVHETTDVPQRMYNLLEAMADRLRKEKVPLDLYQKHRWSDTHNAAADLLDLALDLKLPVADPPAELEINLIAWARSADSEDEDDYDEDEGGAAARPDKKGRPRDLVKLVGDKRFAETVRNGVREAAGNPDFETAATGKAGLKEARREWLQGLVDDVTKGALPQADAVVSTLQSSTSAATFDEFPEQYEQLQQLDLLPVVTRTIQAGLMDEYGWPAFEAAFEKLTSEKGKQPSVYGYFPYIVITDGLNVTVLRGNETVLETQVKLPKGTKLNRLHYVDGDLIVWAEKNYETNAYWHSQPKISEKGWSWGGGAPNGMGVDLPGGGTFFGTQTVHKGDKTGIIQLNPGEIFYHDGQHFWKQTWEGGYTERILREVNPVDGKEGRKSLPSWFEDYLEGDAKLDVYALQLCLYGDLVNDSPIGSKDGMIGFRSRTRGKRHECEGIDGRKITSDVEKFDCRTLINQPGTKGYLPITNDDELWDPTGSYAVANLSGTRGAYARGQLINAPLTYLHFYSLRDEDASKKLRAITQKQVAELLEAEAKDFADHKGKSAPAEATGYPTLDKAIKKLLPKLKDERFHAGLRGVIVLAGLKTRQLKRLLDKQNPENAAAAVAFHAADTQAQDAIRKLGQWFHPEQGKSVFAAFTEAGRFFKGETDEPHFPEGYVEALKTLLDNLPLKLWRHYAKNPDDLAWFSFIEAWCDLPLQDLPGKFRYYSTDRGKGKLPFGKAQDAEDNEDDDDLDDDDDNDANDAYVYIQGQNRFLINESWRYYYVLEYAPTGKFEKISGLSQEFDEDDRSSSLWSAEQLRTFVTKARSTPVPIPSLEFMQQLAEQTGFQLAEVVYLWFASPGENEYRSNFMPAHLRDPYKLKAKEFASAKQSISALTENMANRLTLAVLNGDPVELWDNPPAKAGERFTKTWGKEKPERLEVPAEASDELAAIMGYWVDKAAMFAALNSPEKSDLFNAKTAWKVDLGENHREGLKHDGGDHVFNRPILEAAAGSIALLSYRLPVGDQGRSKMPAVLKAMRAALANPKLLLGLPMSYHYGAKSEDLIRQKAETAVGKLKKSSDQHVGDDGTLSLMVNGYCIFKSFRPAKLKTEQDYRKLQDQIAVVENSSDADEDGEEPSNALLTTLQAVQSDDFQAICDRIAKTPVPEGQYEANPLLSAPELVAKVAGHHGISQEAAAYYLQLLALPDPTDKNVQTWNGWTAANRKKYAKELLAQKLILDAKRSRAGRSYFLPGGWEALKAPHLPLETWKMPLFRMTRDRNGHATPPLQRILPLEPVHSLFARAWERIENGDLPSYEEVKK